MRKASHKKLSRLAFKLLNELQLGPSFSGEIEEIVELAWKPDEIEDLEFVLVLGSLSDDDRDDPHAGSDGEAVVDKPFYKVDPDLGLSGVFNPIYCTAYNHYIDIAKGRGRYDDYDGYSYGRGSARKKQYEGRAWTFGRGYDGVIAEAMKRCYVHVKGRRFYIDSPGRECSPSTHLYSFPSDMERFVDPVQEGLSRFPNTSGTFWRSKGVSDSVFLPVDNMARKRFSVFLSTGEARELGYVLHAIQDASVPHHAAGRAGNWHMLYEETLDNRVRNWIEEEKLDEGVKELFSRCLGQDGPAPGRLVDSDRSRLPGVGWNVESMVTWLALNAFHEYEVTFKNFKHGPDYNSRKGRTSIREMAIKATAISMLALVKADRESRPS